MVGKIASSMDACSKPVCLISRKKRSQDLSVGNNTKGPKPAAARPAAKVQFAVDVEAHAEPTK